MLGGGKTVTLMERSSQERRSNWMDSSGAGGSTIASTATTATTATIATIAPRLSLLCCYFNDCHHPDSYIATPLQVTAATTATAATNATTVLQLRLPLPLQDCS